MPRSAGSVPSAAAAASVVGPAEPMCGRAHDGRPIYVAAEPLVREAQWRNWAWLADSEQSKQHGFGVVLLGFRKTGVRADEDLAVATSLVTYVGEHIEPRGAWWLFFSADCAPSLLVDWLAEMRLRGLSGKRTAGAKTLKKYLFTIRTLLQWADRSFAAHRAWQPDTAAATLGRMLGHVCARARPPRPQRPC